MSANKKSLGPQAFLYPLPAVLVATYDAQGKPNVMTAAWAGIAASEPLSLAVSIRPLRWTHDAILQRKAFTVGIPTEGMAVETDFVGIVSGRRADKTARAGFDMPRSEKVDAPYVAQCPVILECSLTQSIDLGSHTMMIGAIVDVKADPASLNKDGVPDPALFKPLLFDSATHAYYGMGKHVGEAFSIGKALIKSDEE